MAKKEYKIWKNNADSETKERTEQRWKVKKEKKKKNVVNVEIPEQNVRVCWSVCIANVILSLTKWLCC